MSIFDEVGIEGLKTLFPSDLYGRSSSALPASSNLMALSSLGGGAQTSSIGASLPWEDILKSLASGGKGDSIAEMEKRRSDMVKKLLSANFAQTGLPGAGKSSGNAIVPELPQKSSLGSLYSSRETKGSLFDLLLG